MKTSIDLGEKSIELLVELDRIIHELISEREQSHRNVDSSQNSLD